LRVPQTIEDQNLVQTTVSLGFLAILQEHGSYLGGYLVTNLWGRPLEFRLSSAVQPNRIQQILYGASLQTYVCADLIGKTLVDKATSPTQTIFTDHEAVLDLRLLLEVPIAWLPPAQDGRIDDSKSTRFQCHPQFPDDANFIRALFGKDDGILNPAEPFMRIREAIAEARKKGALSRA
jgi:hypothetical protein